MAKANASPASALPNGASYNIRRGVTILLRRIARLAICFAAVAIVITAVAPALTFNRYFLEHWDLYHRRSRELGLDGEDVAATLVDFGRRNQITQIYITRPGKQSVLPALCRDPAQRIVDAAKDMQVVIVSDRQPIRQ
jgi:K+-sensing histidine kinase KdpD